jgi:demethylmenaquinone methyltransferase / 2-methoxy-6-polyprenyl-1,4-benzoquinol methylase
MSDGLRGIFAEVAPTYERVNRILTLGLDARWRKAAARQAAAPGGARWLDVCSGTGDMVRALARRAPTGTSITSLDFCAPMLRLAAGRDPRRRVAFVLGDARRLPFPDAAFDLLTISFATRNLNLSREILEETFRELRRVLKPGGRFVNLETSQPRGAAARFLFRAYIQLSVRPIGRRISGTSAGYAYLASTIPRFHPAERLADILRQAGFSEVTYRRLWPGAAAIHVAVR